MLPNPHVPRFDICAVLVLLVTGSLVEMAFDDSRNNDLAAIAERYVLHRGLEAMPSITELHSTSLGATSLGDAPHVLLELSNQSRNGHCDSVMDKSSCRFQDLQTNPRRRRNVLRFSAICQVPVSLWIALTASSMANYVSMPHGLDSYLTFPLRTRRVVWQCWNSKKLRTYKENRNVRTVNLVLLHACSCSRRSHCALLDSSTYWARDYLLMECASLITLCGSGQSQVLQTAMSGHPVQRMTNFFEAACPSRNATV
mmetsp:Transcript_99659/g.157179  ORF Transcript_99659/g.157179 Transcript_99659/m.157179 type:complete len:256 (-) Transcript_99659:645-1412(-)